MLHTGLVARLYLTRCEKRVDAYRDGTYKEKDWYVEPDISGIPSTVQKKPAYGTPEYFLSWASMTEPKWSVHSPAARNKALAAQMKEESLQGIDPDDRARYLAQRDLVRQQSAGRIPVEQNLGGIYQTSVPWPRTEEDYIDSLVDAMQVKRIALPHELDAMQTRQGINRAADIRRTELEKLRSQLHLHGVPKGDERYLAIEREMIDLLSPARKDRIAAKMGTTLKGWYGDRIYDVEPSDSCY